jgi:hypothetical protein
VPRALTPRTHPPPPPQRSEEHQFLFEAPAATPVDELTATLVSLYNARLHLARLCAEAGELAAYGPARPPEEQARSERRGALLRASALRSRARTRNALLRLKRRCRCCCARGWRRRWGGSR